MDKNYMNLKDQAIEVLDRELEIVNRLIEAKLDDNLLDIKAKLMLIRLDLVTL